MTTDDIRAFGDALRDSWQRMYQADQCCLETALAMAWTCLGDDWTRLVVETHQGRLLPERRVVDQGRVIHRQWWDASGTKLTLRQEWCP